MTPLLYQICVIRSVAFLSLYRGPNTITLIPRMLWFSLTNIISIQFEYPYPRFFGSLVKCSAKFVRSVTRKPICLESPNEYLKSIRPIAIQWLYFCHHQFISGSTGLIDMRWKRNLCANLKYCWSLRSDCSIACQHSILNLILIWSLIYKLTNDTKYYAFWYVLKFLQQFIYPYPLFQSGAIFSRPLKFIVHS